MKKTPILVLAYNRPDSLDKTLAKLSKCSSSNQYTLYVHIDGPNIYKDYDLGQIERIKNNVSKYNKSFKQIEIQEERYHCGLANSVIKSVSEIISLHGQIIVMEDDLIVSNDFLDYMERTLAYYKDDHRIWSVTGFCPPLDCLKDYDRDFFLSYRGESLGWGTWKDRWELVDWKVSDYNSFINDYNLRLDFTKGGYDLPEMLKGQMEGLIDSWAIRWCYSQNKYNMMTVCPSSNRVYHIGIDNATHVNFEFPQMELKEDYPLYAFDEIIDDDLISEFRRYNNGNPSTWNDIFDVDISFAKFESMFNVMHVWKTLNEQGHSIAEYFDNRSLKTVAIYGRGKIGAHIEKELDGSDVEVVFYIDNNPDICDGKRCFAMKDNWPECDCIVISVTTMVNDIYENVREKYMGTIKSIIDVLRDK